MLFDRAIEAFRTQFEAEPALVSIAPGRVNLIGEHTDYNDGFVFPAAIDLGVAVAIRPTEGPSRLWSATAGPGEPFDASHVEKGAVDGWARYPASVAWVFRDRGLTEIQNIEAAVVSDLPTSSGLSSSAAIEMAFAFAWNELNGFGLSPLELAKLGQRAENAFVGVNCGIMDQLASACGKVGHAMYTDTRSLEIRYAAIPENLRIVIGDTMTSRELAGSAYNDRRALCEQAAQLLGVEKLRDARLDDLLEKEAQLSPEAMRAARHVITENTRCQGYFWALEDGNELRIGLLMRASHESLAEDFRVTSPALDDMAEAMGSAPGCVGARMTGAGFGGCCVALVNDHQLDAFLRSVTNRYQSKHPEGGRFYVCRAAEGARSSRL